MYLRRIIFIFKTTTIHVDQRKNSHQPATKVVRNSAVELITRFHEDNNLDMKEDIAFVTVSLFNDERYLERFSNWLKTAKKMDKPDDFFVMAHVKLTYLILKNISGTHFLTLLYFNDQTRIGFQNYQMKC